MVEIIPGSGLKVSEGAIFEMSRKHSSTAKARFLLNCFLTSDDIIDRGSVKAVGKTLINSVACKIYCYFSALVLIKQLIHALRVFSKLSQNYKICCNEFNSFKLRNFNVCRNLENHFIIREKLTSLTKTFNFFFNLKA